VPLEGKTLAGYVDMRAVLDIGRRDDTEAVANGMTEVGLATLNPTGKVDRVTLKRMAEDHLHPHGLEQ
jgi:DNA-binding Xre family transcriptional regulator